MKKLFYALGRLVQILGLIILPQSIWVGHFYHSERGAITIFLAGIAVFVVGYFLTVFSSKL